MNSPQAPWTKWFQGACLLFLLSCAACSSQKPADLVIINGKEPESLDPAIFTAQADGRIVGTIFEGLTRYNEKDASGEPGLAERWDISEDGRIYTFHMRANAKWSTGERITARDVEESWFRILEPETGSDYSGILFFIKGAEKFATATNATDRVRANVGMRALDDATFRVELINPTPFFLELCAYSTLAVTPGPMIKKYGDRWLNVFGVPCSGPYQFVSWRLNDRIRVRKNPHYWDAANTQLEVVDFLPVTLPSTALNLYDTREADIVWDKDLVPTEILADLRKRDDFHTFANFATYFLRFNTTRKPFSDPRVRKAFGMALDRKRIVERITKGGEYPASFIVPPGLPGYQSPEGLTHNPEEARRLLAEAGYPGGKGFPNIDYIFNTQRDHEKIAVEMKEMWFRELGIDVGLRAVEFKVWIRTQSDLDYDVIRSSWVGDYSDPNTFLDLFMSNNPNNRTGWKNPAYDEMLRHANSLSDTNARARFLHDAEKLLVRDEAPILPLYIYNGYNIWDPQKIAGIHNNLRDEHPVRAIRRLAPRK